MICPSQVRLPAICYILLARNGYCSWRAVMAVGLGGLRFAGFLLPEVDQQYLPSLKWISVLLELMFVATVVRRLRPASSGDDALARIRSAVSAIIPYERFARLIAAEVAVLYYALFSWRELSVKACHCISSSGITTRWQPGFGRAWTRTAFCGPWRSSVPCIYE